jgi:hypothetical protein
MKTVGWAIDVCQMFTVGKQKCNGFPYSREKKNYE